MAIYKMVGDKKALAKVAQTSFPDEHIREREVQRMLLDQPEVLEEGLLIIAEEFGNWEESRRRIDLLGLDTKGNLVVVELKRDDTGGHMDLQAIRYAAMVANMTFQDIVDTYQDYLDKRANEEDSGDEPDDAESRLREHLASQDQDEPVIHTGIPRIILASENFGKELTTCVMWLNDSWLRDAGQQITCVRLQPHRNGDEILIEASVVIPLPEASDYQTQLGKREQETRSESSRKSQNVPGAEAFEESIGRAAEQHRPGLVQLYEAAIAMEEVKIVELSTTVSGSSDRYTIHLKVPGKNQMLVSFANLLQYKGKEYGGEISFWPTWDILAPGSRHRIDKLIAAETSQKPRYRRLSQKKYDWEAILAAIRNAYQEASELTVEEE